MENRTWQPIPGRPDAFVYLYVRPPDVLSANSYLVEFPDCRILIDPGALPPQTDELRRILGDRDGGRGLPLLVCVTHCHLDHSREVAAWLADPSQQAWFAAQEHGARALAAGDGRQTAADMYGMDIPHLQADVLLLTEADVLTGQSRRIQLAEGGEARVRTEKRGDAVRQALEWGNDGAIEILPCAGHSPDSICVRIGGVLFIGDLLVASRPLIAGLHGWDPRQLKRSLAGIIQLLEEGEIAWCCPGHGNPLPAEKTLELLRRQRDHADRTDDIEEMNVQRLFRTVDGALELIDEAEETFSAIAGRLLYVADRLDLLGEPDMAQRCREAMDMDAADALLQAFRDRCRAFSAGGVPRVAFAVEALPLVEKLRNRLAPESLRAFLPAALVSRAQRLLLDFIGLAQGTRNLEEFVPTDVGALLAEIETAWQASPHLDGAIADAADDPSRFAAELARRIGHPPPARRMPVRFEPFPGGPLVPVAAVRFGDTLISFLEWLALAGAATATVAGGDAAARTIVEIRTTGWTPDESPRTLAKLRAFERRFALAGFELAVEPSRFRLVHAAPAR